MPTTVHLPGSLLSEVDKRAKSLQLSRNRFIVNALEKALAEQHSWSPAFLQALQTFTPLGEEHDLSKLIVSERRSRKSSPL